MNALKRLVSVMLLFVCALPALAQEEWTFTLTPTVWGAGLSGALQIGRVEEGLRVNFTDSFGMAEIGGGLAFEANNGRIGVLVEGIKLDVSGGADPPSINTEIADITVDHQIWTLAATYRVRDARPAIDAVLGLRSIEADADMRILTGGAVVRQGAQSEDWIDVTLGARLTHDIGERWSAIGYVDFGDGGTKLSYQVNVGAVYRFSSRVATTFGFRMISSDYVIRIKNEEPPPTNFVTYHYGSMKIGGPYVGVQFGW